MGERSETATGGMEATDLTGRLLIAMPGMGDPRFERAVVFLFTHTDEGAMGVIVNQPSGDVDFGELTRQLKLRRSEAARDIPVHVGGPVEPARGFVLHSADYRAPEGTMGCGAFGMTATKDVLADLAIGAGPRDAILALGYAGWGPGQLEGEIARNGWLTADAGREIVFETDPAERWSAALASLGIDPVMLSAQGGRA